jgi:hypothetical protein
MFMRTIVFVLIGIAIVSVLLVTFYPRKEEGLKNCLRDEDCVPAQCCHPTDCVNVENKPDCEGIVCTMECRPGTMDCGQGYCACVENECKAIIG